MDKQQLANKIWESANKLRSKIEANEYKDYILGFMFYKFLSQKEEELLRTQYQIAKTEYKSVLVESNVELRDAIRDDLYYFIPYNHLFSTWIQDGNQLDVGRVQDALNSFERLLNDQYNRIYKGIFDTLQLGLTKLGDNSGAQSKAIQQLISLIDEIPMDGSQDYDVLGFVYEYLISNFAANAGKKAGEFYTPHEVSVLMSEIIAHHLQGRNEISIYDPTSGSGSLLIHIGKSIAKYRRDKNSIKYYAQELKEATYNLTRMNLIMRNIQPSNIMVRNADTLEDDWPYFDEADPQQTYNPLYLDAVVSNPPYSQHWDPKGKENDPRYSRFGLAPATKADYAFVLHDLYHLRPNGIMTIVLPHGVLFRGDSEGEIRKALIDNNHIDAIIGLPANIFFGTSIPTIIMVLRQKRENQDVLVIDASEYFVKANKNNKLQASDIRRVIDAYCKRETIAGYCTVVSRDEIIGNDYNLNIPRYVDTSKNDEIYDIYGIVHGGIPYNEIEKLSLYWNVFEGLDKEIFKQGQDGYYSLVEGNIAKIVQDYPAVNAFTDSLGLKIDHYIEHVSQSVIDNFKVGMDETVWHTLSNELFEQFSNIPLIDTYDIYQIMSDNWSKITLDIDKMGYNGKALVASVEPNMVMKKKNNKQVEVQDGWKGAIVPFELVQELYLQNELSNVTHIENELEAIKERIAELAEAVPMDYQDMEFLNDDRTGFVKTPLNAAVKIYKDEPELYPLLKAVKDLYAEETKLKKCQKEAVAELADATKYCMENLTDEQIDELLYQHWIVPAINELKAYSKKVINDFVQCLSALSNKYGTSLQSIDNDIRVVEQELITLLRELEANDDMGISALLELLGAK